MIQHNTQVRVRYAETDQMGVVYYGNYATYLEVARVETLRQLGLSYKELEDIGYLMPVVEYKTKYLRSARYDDLLTIKTFVRKKPTVKMIFENEIYNSEGTLINTSEVTLVFFNRKLNKVSQAPEEILALCEKYF